MNGDSAFSNDVPSSEEPECKVPEDSNNSDNCAQQNEFGDCKLCNSGYELQVDSSCDLKDEEVAEDEVEPAEDDETISEDIFWQTCQTSTAVKGWLCPADKDDKC